MSGIYREGRNSEACNLRRALTHQHSVERRYWLLSVQPLHGRLPSFKTSYTHTHAQREVVYKYKMKFPSSARWPQPKGLCWFGSCDRSAATVSDSGSILNRADRSWSAGRNRNQMWDLAAKTGSSKKPEGRDGGRPAEAPSQPPNRTTFQGLGGFRWGQQSPREENQKIKKNMVRWREDRNHREREVSPESDCRHSLQVCEAKCRTHDVETV